MNDMEDYHILKKSMHRQNVFQKNYIFILQRLHNFYSNGSRDLTVRRIDLVFCQLTSAFFLNQD